MEVTDFIVAFLADWVSHKFMACPQAYIKYGLILVFWFDVYYNTILPGGENVNLFTSARVHICVNYVVATMSLSQLPASMIVNWHTKGYNQGMKMTFEFYMD